ncbi:hypothetical protein FB45DRAFT_919125 [Roridomyces roridus]|uniref:Plus3 domain-containing protein n=1 Tax=Roridomyces roridus TaxID=1738132 RepID=A0AAD7FN95_9AGAR|nr:hypothetical protein FB45DRAFT_919125 [Roridomyces roridus]
MSSELDDELLELVGGDDKRSRKRNRESGSPGPNRSKSSKSKKRKVADSDNEPESEDGDDAENKYPLEGKYIDEEDRENLLSKTEIEREEILASRMDELERIRDRKHVDKLRAQQLAGIAAVENDSKRPARSSGKDKSKDRTLTALKAKRRAKDEKKRSRGTSPRGRERSSSPMDMDMSESDSEDGQISKLDQEDERLFGKPKSNGNPPAEELPLTSDYLRKASFSRDTLAKHATSPWFEKIIVGGWVRYFIGIDDNQQQSRVYRICQIVGLSPSPKPYKLGERTTQFLFDLKHGGATRAWQMDRTSNDPWSEDEFERLKKTCAMDKVDLPTRKEVDERSDEINELRNKQVTEADINEMIQARKRAQTNGTPGPMSVAERSRLIAQRTLAQRRQDYEEVRQIDEQLAKLGDAPGEEKEKDVLADRLAAVNARNRKANQEAVRRAEMLEAERKRRERRGGASTSKVVDPSARLRTVPRLFESMTPTSRPSTPNPATLGTGSPAPEVVANKSPAPRPSNGKTFEATVIESIEVDLGDF